MRAASTFFCSPRFSAARVFSTFLVFLFFLSAFGASGQQFVDIGPESGLSAGNSASGFGNGVTFTDLNGDGWDDVAIVNPNDSLHVFINEQGSFTKIPSPVFCPPGTLQVLWGDYDNDGELDLLMSVRGGVNRLFRNLGGFTFEDVTVEAGLPLTPAENYGVTFGDYDLDGYLDIYICRYYAPQTSGGSFNVLLHNNGDGTFTDVTTEAGVGDGLKPSFMGVWADLNNNGLPDLFVINDRMPGNSLYKNNGDGTFTDITESAQVGFPFNDPMSATVGDFDNDGYLDIFMSNGGSDINMPPLLLLNNGDETFTEVAQEFGITGPMITWGAVWVDMDNNTLQDLFFTTSDPLPNRLFRNNGNSTFSFVPQLLEAPARSSYTCAKADFDQDGYEDIVVHNAGQQPLLMHNTGGSNHFIKFTLEGTVSNRFAVGTWVRLSRGGQTYVKYTLCGENFKGQDSRTLTFGMGENDAPADSVSVTYASGHTDTYYGLALDTIHHFTEGETFSTAIEAETDVICAGDSIVLTASGGGTFLWSTGDTTSSVTAFDAGSYAVTLTNAYGIAATDTFELTVAPTPVLSIELSAPSCHDSADGAVEITNLTGVPADTLIWMSDSADNVPDSLAAGTYPFIFTDVNGCSTTESITLTAPAALDAAVFSQNEIEGGDGFIFISPFGGTPPYEIFKNGAPAENNMTDLSSGTYLILLRDANLCEALFEVTIEGLMGTENRSERDFEIFPNPASERINLQSDLGISAVEMTDVRGKSVKLQPAFGSENFDVSDLPAGVYLIRVVFSDRSYGVRKLIKR